MSLVLTLLVGVGMMVAAVAQTNPVVSAPDGGNGKREVVLLDDCDPRDPTWAPIGGCSLPDGLVTRAEFFASRFSPLWVGVIGHPAWRFDPGYIKIETGKELEVANYGGRVHTFTKVAAFGGGRVDLLNGGSAPAPECATAKDLRPGDEDEVAGLSEGNHRFQCCRHPWMRTLVKVKPDNDNH